MNSPCVNCGADSRVCKECDWYNGVWIPKDQYEARLKADLVAILTDLQSEIDEKATELCDDGWWLTYNNLIQQKINALKTEVSEENYYIDEGKSDV